MGFMVDIEALRQEFIEHFSFLASNALIPLLSRADTTGPFEATVSGCVTVVILFYHRKQAASWMITSVVLLAAVLAVSDISRDSGRCRGRLVRGQRYPRASPTYLVHPRASL
jgi:hypothetical protein